jgi:DNA-directed RNA polymerase
MMTIDTTEEDLMSTQVRLEEEMTSRGAEKYIKNTHSSKERGAEDSTSYGQTLVSHRVALVAQAIDAWKLDMSLGNAGRRYACYPLVKDIPSNVLAFLTLKNLMAGISSVRTLQFVGVAIGTAVEDEVRLAGIRKDERQRYERIMVGAKKRSSYHYKHVYALRQADKFSTWDNWTRTDRLHVGIKLLDVCVETIGIVEITHQKVDKNQSIKYVKALPSTLAWIEKKNDVMASLRPVFEPMVVKPRDWTTPSDGGYISSNIKPLQLVKTENKNYIEELNNTDMPIVYEAVNKLQHTAWQINSQVLEVMKVLWDSGVEVAGLPSRDGMELPPKPHDIATNEEAKREWRIQAAKMHVQNLSIAGQRVSFSMALGIAKRYEKYRKIYFPYQLDFRGRIYAVPQLNPQGADFHKSLLRFAVGKPLGKEGWKWLAFQGANVAGYDKVTLEQRVEWVLDHEEEIVAIANDPYNNKGWQGTIGDVEIDKPWQFLAFCFEWAGYVEHGDSFVSKISVAFDGSCSGIQHFSSQLRDELGGSAVNLIPMDTPQDVYKLVADKVLEQVNHDVIHGTEDEVKHYEDGTAYVKAGTKTLAKQWLVFGINRKTTKRPVMTLAYGSKEYGFKTQLMEDILRPAYQACQRAGTTFAFTGDGYQGACYLAKAIWMSVNVVLVKAGEAMKWLQSAASIAASEELPVRWTTPIGFPVMQSYPDLQLRRVKTSISGKLVYLTMYKEKDKLNKSKMSSAISPNYIHSCDAAHMGLTVVRASQEGLTNFAMIHDSFGTTAGDAQELYRIVRETFIEMYDQDVLENFRDEITSYMSPAKKKAVPELPTRGTLDLSNIIDSSYCFA